MFFKKDPGGGRTSRVYFTLFFNQAILKGKKVGLAVPGDGDGPWFRGLEKAIIHTHGKWISQHIELHVQKQYTVFLNSRSLGEPQHGGGGAACTCFLEACSATVGSRTIAETALYSVLKDSLPSLELLFQSRTGLTLVLCGLQTYFVGNTWAQQNCFKQSCVCFLA